MKKILLSTIIIFINLSVFSQTVVYNSNLIGQKMGLLDGSSEYTLKVVTNEKVVTTFLYLNDIEIKKTEVSEIGNNKTVIITEKDKVQTETYLNNVPLKIIDDSGIVSYTYEGGKLITKTLKFDDSIQSFSRYYYSGDSLVAIFRNIKGNMEYYVFKNDGTPELSISNGNKFTEINVHNTLLTSNTYEGNENLSFNNAIMNDDGSLMIKTTKDGKTHDEYYDVDGLLYKEDVLNKDNLISQTTVYEYDDFNNVLQSIETIFDETRKVEDTKKTILYENGKIQKILIEKEGVLISSSKFNEYGKKVETLYKNGLKYCTITYNLDGKKILDIQYEKR